MKNENRKQYRDSGQEKQLTERARSKKRRRRNKGYTGVSFFFIIIFMGLIGYLIYFNTIKSDDFINSPYNTRQDTFADRVVRGKIMSSDGEVLAQTNVSEDGTEERSYPYNNVFAHVVGYDSNGKSGLESEANFQLLSSHEFFLNQIRNEFMGTKNTGDTVVSTLNADLQTTAYNSLGDRRGAVVALEPSTGKILALVSKPDFDPNTISENWNTLVNDETNSSLLNRATMGQYPLLKLSQLWIIFVPEEVSMVFHLTARVVSQKKIILFSAIMAKYMVQKIFILHSQTPVTVLLQKLELNLGEPLCSKQAKIFFLTKNFH